MSEPALEPVVAGFLDATRDQPSIHLLGPEVGRKAIDDVQSPPVDVPGTEVEDITAGGVPVRLVRLSGVDGPLPAVIYLHGGGWVFGGPHSHDRLVRELALGSGAVVVFVDYALSPESRYPTALDQTRAVARWVADDAIRWCWDAATVTRRVA